jgi:hypothetical protein
MFDSLTRRRSPKMLWVPSYRFHISQRRYKHECAILAMQFTLHQKWQAKRIGTKLGTNRDTIQHLSQSHGGTCNL